MGYEVLGFFLFQTDLYNPIFLYSETEVRGFFEMDAKGSMIENVFSYF